MGAFTDELRVAIRQRRRELLHPYYLVWDAALEVSAPQHTNASERPQLRVYQRALRDPWGEETGAVGYEVDMSVQLSNGYLHARGRALTVLAALEIAAWHRAEFEYEIAHGQTIHETLLDEFGASVYEDEDDWAECDFYWVSQELP